MALGPSGSGDYSSHLSAREQEHVARVTGSPLINVAGSGRPVMPSAGLVGAIEAREKEKREMKQGLSSQAVQHAIAQRQQQAQMQSYQQYSEQYSAPQEHYGHESQYAQQQQHTPPGQYPSQPQYFSQPPNSQRQDSWQTPGAANFPEQQQYHSQQPQPDHGRSQSGYQGY